MEKKPTRKREKTSDNRRKDKTERRNGSSGTVQSPIRIMTGSTSGPVFIKCHRISRRNHSES